MNQVLFSHFLRSTSHIYLRCFRVIVIVKYCFYVGILQNLSESIAKIEDVIATIEKSVKCVISEIDKKKKVCMLVVKVSFNKPLT